MERSRASKRRARVVGRLDNGKLIHPLFLHALFLGGPMMLHSHPARKAYLRKPSAKRPRFVPYLEVMEDRNLPSVSAFFDAPSGILALRGDAGDNTVREILSPGGFLELALDGQRHSSDPTSAAFDKALAGARAGTLAGLWFDGGGGHDTLTLASQQLAGGLRV